MVGTTATGLVSISLMLALAAPAANAFVGGLADDFCLDITTVAEEVEAELQAQDLSAFGERECRNVCKEARTYCQDTARSRRDCREDSNKVEERIEREDCRAQFPQDKQQRRDCQRAAKDARQECDRNDRDDRRAEHDECRALEDTCRTSICGQ